MIAFFHWFGKLHRWVYARNGAIGRRFAWIPCLVLTTTGRKSGQPRDSVLVYADDGATRVVVASNGGSDRPPAWLLNVQGRYILTLEFCLIFQTLMGVHLLVKHLQGGASAKRFASTETADPSAGAPGARISRPRAAA